MRKEGTSSGPDERGPRAARTNTLLERLEAERRAHPDAVELDVSDIEATDSQVLASLRAARERLAREGTQVRFIRAAKAVEPLLEGGRKAPEGEPASRLERLGRAEQRIWMSLFDLADVAVETARGIAGAFIGRRTFTPSDVVDQSVRIGVDALPIIAMLSFLLGTVLAFQTWVQLEYYGFDTMVLDLVGLGMAREFAAFIVAVIVAGRSGSAIAAELSTMEMGQENDVLRVMGISPVRHLVVPRMLAITLVMPGLALFADAVGILGGLAAAMWLGLPWVSGLKTMLAYLTLDDLWLGVVKSVLFGWVIGLSASFMGLHSGHSPRSVGVAATRAVVASIFFIIVVDSIVTTIWTMAQ